MGSAFAIPGIAPIILEAVSVVKARGGTVSFDPNVRKELMSGGGEAKRQFDSVLDVTDLLLPSGEELSIATGVDGEVLAIESLLARGISEVVLKRGAAGVFTLQPQPRGGRLSGIRGRGNRPDGGRRLLWSNLSHLPPQGARAAAGTALRQCRRGPQRHQARSDGGHVLSCGTRRFHSGQSGAVRSGKGFSMSNPLLDLAKARRNGRPRGITSVCSAHPVVLRAALRLAAKTQQPVLIEATCNQVNHLGGYTGMTPSDFVGLVESIAAEEGLDRALLIFGGDHLGPNPWRSEDPAAAMEKAKAMVAAYVAAGFSKIHLDASMGCAGEPAALNDATIATRAAALCAVAEDTARDHNRPMPVYILGTEVPVPGGADHVLDTVEPTSADAAVSTIAIHRDIFEKGRPHRGIRPHDRLRRPAGGRIRQR